MSKRYLNRDSHEALSSVIRSENRMRAQNMLVSGAGQGGAGDRAANASVPFYSTNPETFTNPLARWREYCLMWQTSWEVKKIVGIPVDDALRKPPVLKGISTKSQETLTKKFDRLQLIPGTKRALKLERLLGGCLQFMGLEGDSEECVSEYHPEEGRKLCFLNSIPISRISRMTWDTNPLHEAYMRPKSFFVNNVEVSVTRCLVWDGQPLFDPNDFALSNYRANLAGFGPSVVGSLFDDVIMACGTRQAAYQMVQVAGAIVALVDELEDIATTQPGQKNLSRVERMINEISVFRTTVLNGKKVDVKSFASSFGEVPALLMTYLQVLSAASDIPACRFLGQAPGGLSTDDRSGLENYYNNIDAFQHERITPQLLRLCDVIGYAEIEGWKDERNELKIEWPPLWNETAKEQAERASTTVDYVLKLRDAGLMKDSTAQEEINSREILSVTLEKSDLDILDDVDGAISRHLYGEDPETGEPYPAGKDLSKLPSEKEKEAAKQSGLLDNGKRVINSFEEQDHPRNADGEFITVYHGSHKRNEAQILKEGIKRPGIGYNPGTVSLATRPDAAFGYSAMSLEGGESGFNDAGSLGKKRPNITPLEDRRVFKVKIPKSWHEANLDRIMYPGSPLEEHRYKADIPPEFITLSSKVGNSVAELSADGRKVLNKKSEAWEKGYSAGYKGEASYIDCPYASGSQEENDWVKGFEKGHKDGVNSINKGYRRIGNAVTAPLVLIDLIKRSGYDPAVFDLKEVEKGYTVEQEHADVTHGDEVETMKIVMAHLTEVSDYYTKLEEVEK